MKPQVQFNNSKSFTRLILILTVIATSLNLLAQPDFNPNSLKLTIVGNGYSDQTFVVIIPGSTTGFDSQYDAYKLMGIYAAPQLYSIISCCNLSVNTIPELYNGMEIQLGNRFGADNSYTISANGLYTFGTDTTIVLEDTKENEFINLMSDSSYTFTGLESDAHDRFKLHYYCPMKFEINTFMEGPYQGAGLMSATLDIQSILPTTQPYGVAPWNYSGTEFVPFFPFNNVVDWLLLELRDAPDAASANASTMIEQRACLLLKNGTITGIDNETAPLFTGVISQNAFIVVRHRNHLSIMSSGPLVRDGGTYSWDFTNSMTQAYGTDAMIDFGDGHFGMFTGDGNADNTVNNGDKISIWQTLVGKSGYMAADYNLSGQVNNTDKNESWLPNVGEATQIP